MSADGLDLDLGRQRANLDIERRILEARVKEIKEQAAPLEEIILNEFAIKGVNAFPHLPLDVEGIEANIDKLKARIREAGEKDRLVKRKKEMRVDQIDGVTAEMACAALRAAGWGNFVKENYHWKRLGSKFTEIENSQIAYRAEMREWEAADPQTRGNPPEPPQELPPELDGILAPRAKYSIQTY